MDAESVLALRTDAPEWPWAGAPEPELLGRRIDEERGMDCWREDWRWAIADVRVVPLDSESACGVHRATRDVIGATSWRWNGISSVIAYMHDEGMNSYNTHIISGISESVLICRIWCKLRNYALDSV